MLFGASAKKKIEQRRAEAYRALLHYEARIGGGMFGPIPNGTRREFFCLDEHTWIWHEEWQDNAGFHAVMTRYDVRPTGVLKSQGTNSYQRLTVDEESNFFRAAKLYCQQITLELQRIHQQAA